MSSQAVLAGIGATFGSNVCWMFQMYVPFLNTKFMVRVLGWGGKKEQLFTLSPA